MTGEGGRVGAGSPRGGTEGPSLAEAAAVQKKFWAQDWGQTSKAELSREPLGYLRRRAQNETGRC